MISKKILKPERVRRINGGFSFIPHQFVTDGFMASLNQKENLLYLFLVLASDRYGLSYYAYDSICTLLQLTLEEYTAARNGLIAKDLIDFNGTLYQVLELPAKPVTITQKEKMIPEKSSGKSNESSTPSSLKDIFSNMAK